MVKYNINTISRNYNFKCRSKNINCNWSLNGSLSGVFSFVGDDFVYSRFGSRSFNKNHRYSIHRFLRLGK